MISRLLRRSHQRDLEAAQASLGLTTDEAAGLGLGPFGGAGESGEDAPSLDTLILDPLGLMVDEDTAEPVPAPEDEEDESEAP